MLFQTHPMSRTGFNYQLFFRNLVNFILWTTLFAIAYSQSPLYTSNQNQYFLHGFAKASVGTLSQDWLANTLDPTPIFSLLVSLTYRYLRFEAIFYVYYALLMGIYLFSLLGIAGTVFDLKSSRTKQFFFIALLVTLHAAGLRFALSRIIGVNWTYILEDGVADQRMLGPVFQPSTFGVFLLLSLYLFLNQRHYWASLAAALAAVVHPTYLLSAAILTLTYMGVIYAERRDLKQSFFTGLVALLAVTPMVLYAWNTFGGSNPETAARARDILVEFRIPHHAKVSEWFDTTAILKLFIITISFILVRRNRLFFPLFISALSAVFLTFLQIVTGSNALALLFPWRLSIFILPLSTTLILAYLVNRLLDFPRLHSKGWHQFIKLLSAGMIFVAVLSGSIRFVLDLDRKANEPERLVQNYVYAHKSLGEIYLIPVKMQDFRLVARAPAFIDFKSIPYKDSEVLEWYARNQLADSFYKSLDCQLLETITDKGDVTHVLVPEDSAPIQCLGLDEIYSDPYYTIYRLPPS